MDNQVLLEHLIASAVWWDAVDAAEDGRIDSDQLEATTDWVGDVEQIHCLQTIADSWPEQWVM